MSWGSIHGAATLLNNRLTVYFVGLVSLFVFHKRLSGQEKLYATNVARSDSVEQSWSDETVYSIEMLRLERWLQENPETIGDSLLMKEVAALKQDAEESANSQDFATAVIWLETIWGVLLLDVPGTLGDSPAEEQSLDLFDSLADDPFQESSGHFSLSRELTSGVDLWRQQFRFAFVQDDSTFVESSGNPFTGVRLNFNYRSSGRRSFQGYTAFRYSRDYLTGEADVKYTNPIGRFSRWHLANRFEANSFYGEFQLKYLQNISELGVSLRDIGPFSLDLKDEFLLRRYAGESQINPNYYDNAFRGQLLLDHGIGTTVGFGYRNTLRSYSTYSQYDYNEHLLDLSLYQNLHSVNLSVEGELRWRDYSPAAADDILQDYGEKYARAEVELPIVKSFGVELRGSITDREYAFLNTSSLPDYHSWDVEPEVYFNLGSHWRLSAGFFYADEKYQDLSTRLAAQAVDADISIPFENNVTFGPILSIEFFQIEGITFTARESFQLQRYPEAETDNILRSNPYSDRNINSLLFYLTLDRPSGWRFAALANIDHDRSRREDSSDFQNTIIGFEINYSF